MALSFHERIIMKYYYDDHILTWPDHFVICDEDGNQVFEVSCKLSIGHVMTISSSGGKRVLSDTISSWFPAFKISEEDKEIGVMKRVFSLRFEKYDFLFHGLYVRGDFLDSNYDIMKAGQCVGHYEVVNNRIIINTDDLDVITFVLGIEALKSLRE